MISILWKKLLSLPTNIKEYGKRESKDRYMSTGKFGDELLCD
jgi:hypothetical protein